MFILFLSDKGFTLKEIALMANRSVRTVQYKLTKFGLSLKNYTHTTDRELDILISQALETAPNMGKRRLNLINYMN